MSTSPPLRMTVVHRSNMTISATNQWRHFWQKHSKQPAKRNPKVNKRMQRKKHAKQQKQHTNNIIKTTRRLFQQLDLHQRNLTIEDGETYGDEMQDKQEHTIRICLKNFNNIRKNHKIYKTRKTPEFITQKKIDVMMMNEVGLCWPKLADEDQWFARIQGKFRASASTFAHNTTELEKTEKLQHGGVGIVITEDDTHRIKERGKDSSMMGRWAWVLLEGRQHNRLRILTAYHPTKNDGPETVHTQQLRHLRRINRESETVSEAFIKDLEILLSSWIEMGDHVIVGMDANQDIRDDTINDMFNRLGMSETILNKHKHRSPPATCNKNKTRTPIDGIWATNGIQPTQAGYLPYGNIDSDHRALWMDVAYETVYGFKIPPMTANRIRRLNTKNPKMVEKYNHEVKTRLQSARIIDKLNQIDMMANQFGWSEALENSFNLLHKQQQEIRLHVEKRIRKLRMGAIPWSPSLQQFRDNIELWNSILKRKRGLIISNTMIRRLIKKVQPSVNPYHLTEEHIVEELKAAHAVYKEAKKNAQVWRDGFLPDLARTRAEYNGTSMESELKKLMHIDNQKHVWRKIKRMRGKLGRNATTMVKVQEDNGLVTLTEKEDIERACIDENVARFSQAEGTPPMEAPLYEALGRFGEGPAVRHILEGTYEAPEELDQYTKKMLKELEMPEQIRRRGCISTEVDIEEHQQAWRRQKEQTSALPNGPTFSHYKASSQDPIMAKFEALLRSLPMKYGFSPKLWQEITDVEILKKTGVYDVSRM